MKVSIYFFKKYLDNWLEYLNNGGNKNFDEWFLEDYVGWYKLTDEEKKMLEV